MTLASNSGFGSPWTCYKIILIFNYFLCQDTAIERATAVFEKLDVNGDGELNEDEFVGGCLKDESLANLLNTGASEEQTNEPEEENSD